MKRQKLIFGTVALVILLASCASGPKAAAPAAPSAQPSPAKDRAMALVKGSDGSATSPAPAGQPAPAPAAASPAAGQPTAPAPIGTVASAAEDRAAQVFLADLPNYLSRLTFLVYWNQDNQLDPRIAKMAVAQADRWLKERSSQEGAFLTVIDADQIEKNRADQASAYQSATGQSQGLIQYLAGKFNANVYIEIDFAVKTEIRDGRYYASTQGSLKMLDIATADVLGTIPFQNMSFSPSSEQDAATNVVLASVWAAMPRVYDQARQIASASARRGLRYEVTIQNSQDFKKIMALEKYLGAHLREVQELSFAPGETRLYVFSFQNKAAVRQSILDGAAQAGMPDFDLVMARDNSFTFNTGL